MSRRLAKRRSWWTYLKVAFWCAAIAFVVIVFTVDIVRDIRCDAAGGKYIDSRCLVNVQEIYP